MTKWIADRMREPSTYAALGLGVVGVGILIDNFWVVLAGMVAGFGAFILKEKRII